MSGAYPRLYAAVEEMIEKRAARVPMARAIVRRAGVRVIAGDPVPARPRTLVDAFVEPGYGALAYEWAVDLSPFSSVRMSSRSVDAVYLMRSEAGGLDPADYEPVVGTLIEGGTPDYTVVASVFAPELGGSLEWVALPEALRAPCVLSVSVSEADMDLSGALPVTGFSLFVQGA